MVWFDDRPANENGLPLSETQNLGLNHLLQIMGGSPEFAFQSPFHLWSSGICEMCLTKKMNYHFEFSRTNPMKVIGIRSDTLRLEILDFFNAWYWYVYVPLDLGLKSKYQLFSLFNLMPGQSKLIHRQDSIVKVKILSLSVELVSTEVNNGRRWWIPRWLIKSSFCSVHCIWRRTLLIWAPTLNKYNFN